MKPTLLGKELEAARGPPWLGPILTTANPFVDVTYNPRMKRRLLFHDDQTSPELSMHLI